MQQRRDEILAKKARLEELRRQNRLRQDQLSSGRPSGETSPIHSPTPGRATNREDLDRFITSIVGDGSRPTSAGPRDSLSGTASALKGSRPNSVLSAGELSAGNSDTAHYSVANDAVARPQILSTAPLSTVYSFAPAPVKEVFTYSKGVQTSEPWTPSQRRQSTDEFAGSDGEGAPSTPSNRRKSKRLSRRERGREEELRENIRREIEEELRALKDPTATGPTDPVFQTAAKENFPARALTDEELGAVTSSKEFLDFVERSSKVIERTLDQEYDVLADYALGDVNGVDEDDEYAGSRGRRRVREIAQFWDERWSKKRIISDIDFSPKFPELLLASYTKNPTAPHDPDGLIQVWNMHLHDRPEYVFHAQSDILVAKFSPFHPNLIIGGAYSGQVLLWDTRAKSAPVQKTPLTGSGHTHPVYSVDIVGTQNANNIISCSTDGVVCGWTVDMLSQPQEFLELITPPPAKTEDLAPTCLAFPQSDPTYFLVGTEEGGIYPCHRYDRAGAKAGVDHRVSYRGHAAPVMSLDFHPARGPLDLGDLVLSSSLDWSVKLWRVRAPAGASAAAAAAANAAAGGSTSASGLGGGGGGTAPAALPVAHPLLDIVREDVVYAARWSPVKPGVFALVDGAGALELWDVGVDVEVPLAKVTPSRRGARLGAGQALTRGLNKVAWERHDGKRVAVGGLDGVVSVFEVGGDFGGGENARAEEWAGVKRLVGRLDGGGRGGNGVH